MNLIRASARVLLAALVMTASLASAQEIELKSWTAPPYWTPPAAESPDVASGAVRGSRTALVTATPLPFVGIAPCRQHDSRSPVNPLLQNTPQTVTLVGAPCGIPAAAQAVAVNVTIFNITGASSNGVFSVGITAPPPTAWINYPSTETQRGNAGVVGLTVAGEIIVQVNQVAGFVDFVVDVFGYYAPQGIVNTLNTLSGDVTLSAGTNVTVTPTGQTLTIAATGATGPTGPTGPQGPPGPTGWALTGNAGTNPATNFLGTMDDQALELRVNSLRVLRFEQATTISGLQSYVGANVLGGSSNNSITLGVTLATIAGGGGTFNGLARPNTVTDAGGTVGGGAFNTAGNSVDPPDDARFATVAGGFHNIASGPFSTMAGGEDNVASGNFSTAAGGRFITASGNFSSVSGGSVNSASGDHSVVAGGSSNTAGGDYSFAAGHQAVVRDAATVGGGNTTGDQGTFVWADSQATNFTSTGPNQFLIRAAGNVGINTNAPGFSLEVMSAGDTQIGLRSDTIGGRVWTIQSSDGQTVGGARAGSFQIVDRTAAANRFLITSAGEVGINTADPLGFQLAVNGTAAKPGGGSWATFSDARLKRDIRPLEGTLDRLLALRGVSFEYIDPAAIHELPGTRIGMVAQDVERVFPDWVSEGPDGYRRLTYRGFEALTVEAMRDLREEKNAEIAALRSAIDAQRAEIAALRGAIEVVRSELSGRRGD